MGDLTSADRPIYLSDVARILSRKWIVILVVSIVGGIVAGILAFTSTPVYRAEVLLSPIQRDQAQGGLSGLGDLGLFASILGGMSLSSAGTAEAIATLTSRSLTDEFIEENDLLRVLFSDDWDEQEARWLTKNGEEPTAGDAFKIFDDRIRGLDKSPDTGLILLWIEWKDPHEAAYWANEIVRKTNASLRAMAISNSEKSIDYLHEELGDTEVVEVRQAIFAVMEKQMQEIMLANVQEEYAFKVIDPAVASDDDKFVRPKRLIMIIVGIFSGFLISCIFVLMRHRDRQNVSL